MVRCKFGDEPDRFLHLPDAGRRRCRELPAVLLVFILEKAGADAERQSSPADQIDARRDLGEMRGISITNRSAKGGQSSAIEKRREHRRSGRLPDQRRDLGDERACNHLAYITSDPARCSINHFDGDRSGGRVWPDGSRR